MPRSGGNKDGDVVRIYNSRGACLAGAVVIDTMLPGVVKLSCRAWYDPAGAEDGAVCVHGNANVLTHENIDRPPDRANVSRRRDQAQIIARLRAVGWIREGSSARMRECAARNRVRHRPPARPH